MTEKAQIHDAARTALDSGESVQLSTRALGTTEGKTIWTTALGQNFCEMDTRWEPTVDHFDGELFGHRFGELTVTTVTADPHDAIRTPAMIADTDDHDFFISLLTRGRGEIHQDRRVARLSNGAFTLVDGARPWMFRFQEPFQQLIVRIPRPVLAARLPEPLSRHLTAAPVTAVEGAGRFVSAVLQQMSQLDPALSAATGAPLSLSALDMLVTALSGVPVDLSPTARAHVDDLHRAHHLIQGQLHDPTLSLADISATLGMSRRYLSQIFREHGSTPNAWLIRARLERGRRLLLTTDASVAEVSDRVGFKDVAHFSRSFRTHFGVSPSRYRTHALAHERQ